MIRSTLTYGQEVYFSAPSYLLQKIQSVDSKSLKLALGVPVHTNTMLSYKEAGVVSISKNRELATSKYVIRSLTINNSVKEEIFIDSRNDFPKRARAISFLQPIKNYTDDLMNKSNIDIKNVPITPTIPSIPQWEHHLAHFDINHTDINKNENNNLLAIKVREHLDNTYKFK